MDKDHDGFITAKDLLFVFGDNQLDYVYLKKLIDDLTKEGKRGYMGYTGFSKWMGNCIHTQDGLYFRHDSLINPEFE